MDDVKINNKTAVNRAGGAGGLLAALPSLGSRGRGPSPGAPPRLRAAAPRPRSRRACPSARPSCSRAWRDPRLFPALPDGDPGPQSVRPRAPPSPPLQPSRRSPSAANALYRPAPAARPLCLPRPLPTGAGLRLGVPQHHPCAPTAAAHPLSTSFLIFFKNLSRPPCWASGALLNTLLPFLRSSQF